MGQRRASDDRLGADPPAAEQVADVLGYGAVEVGRIPDGVDVVVIVGRDAPIG